jgi:lipopolysaccharide transport system permease protein
MFMVMWAFFLIRGGSGRYVSPFLLRVPLLSLQMVLLGMGFGILISSMTTKYRDLAMLVSFGLQLWHYATPVAYGLQLIPEKYTLLIMLNPMTMIIVTFRFAFFGAGYFSLHWYLFGWLLTLLIVAAGLLLFGRVERTFMDTI